MLVMSVNSKRQRRPNVRLGEIGDISAAWACGFSQNTRENLAHITWKHDDEQNPLHGYFKPLSPELPSSEFRVTPQILTELQQNRENNNPNSSEIALESPTSAELIDMTKSKLNFGNVTRKCRDMKRRGRGRNDGYAILGGSWSSKHSPEFDSVDEKGCDGVDNAGCKLIVCDGYYSADGFDDSSDHQTPTTSKEAWEYYNYRPSTQQEGKLNDDVPFEGEKVHPKSGNVWDENEMRFGNDDVNAVGRWLEEVGFGKYAGVFEMHEVDEEALPLLTLEDLKEMGFFSVGPRRRLYNAIRQLRGEE